MSVDPVSLAVTVALNAASMALTASQEFEGPRLDSLKVTASDYGTPLDSFYGTKVLTGRPIIFAEDLREVEETNKTKGGKYNNFKYFATFAFLIADHEIDQVLRVWFDEHLVYDATGAGPLSPFSVSDGASITEFMRFYTGAADQEPDPRMLATIEALHGAGTCPAYRGVAYGVVEELPVEKLGNRIPQIKVEATANGAGAFPYEVFDSPIGQPYRLWGFTYSPDGSRLIYGQSGGYAIWDVAARSPMISGTFPVSVMTSQKVFGWDREGYLYVAGNEETVGGNIHVLGPDGTTAVETITLTPTMSLGAASCTVKSYGEGYPEFLVAYPPSTTEVLAWKRLGNPTTNFVDTSTIVGTGFTATAAFVDDNGDLWVGGAKKPGSQTTAYFLRLTADGAELAAPALVTVTGLPAASSPDVYALWHDGAIVLSWDATGLYRIDPADGSVLASSVFNSDVFNTGPQFENYIPGSSRLWVNAGLDAYEINLADLSTIRTVDTTDWGGNSADGIIYDRLNHALITAPSPTDQELAWRYLDRADGSGVTLRSIVEDVTEKCGLTVATDIDATALDQTVLGFSWTQGTGKQILEALLEGHASFVRPHDFKLEFKKRGGAGSGSIPVEDMGAGAGQASTPRYKVSRTLDTDLPRRAALTFADPAIDQQPNTAISQRNAAATDGVREISLDLSTLALEADDARPMVDAWLRRTWYNAEGYELAVTRAYTALEPGDHKLLDFDGQSKTAELLKITFGANGVLPTEWRRDLATVHVTPTQPGAPADGVTPPPMLIFGLSRGFVLDIPLVQDADNGTNPILYFAAGPYTTDGAWPGAQVYESPDGSAYSSFASVPAASIVTWGYANGALSDALSTVWDRNHTVSVTVKSGSLTSASEAAIDANPRLNQALLGSEILQFATATLVSSDSSGKVYTLSGFKRGRRGTEVFTGSHASGEQFVLLDQLGDEDLGAGDIGDTLYFKVATQGRDISSAPASSLTYAANSHKPYAPAHFKATRNTGTGDWTFTWRRRSRIGYRWTGASTVPLGEATEAYEVDIYNGASVVRTISASSQTATYTNAQQVTDFGSGQATLTAHVRQIGDLVDGRETTGSF